MSDTKFEVKVDVTSAVGEKVVDKVFGFVSTLIKPSVKQSGLLIKDRVTLYRFEKQIKILEKARQICEKHNVSTKVIKLKLLCPLLDFAGIEDDEELENRWSNLLANMVDSNQNIDNHVFPYILSQISLEEFNEIQSSFLKKINRQNLIKAEYDELYTVIKFSEKDILEETESLEKERSILRASSDVKTFERYFEITDKIAELRKPTKQLRDKASDLFRKFYLPEVISNLNLEDFEYSNLIRLGLIKSVQTPTVEIEGKRIDKNEYEDYIYLEDLNFIVDNELSELHLTELGEKFISATLEMNTVTMPERLIRL